LYAELDEKSRLLEQASEAKSRFLSSVSHELRGPANSIVGLARLLLSSRGTTIDESQHRQIELLASSASELLSLVNQLLDLAKAESGRLDARVRLTDISPMLAEIVAGARPLARQGVELVLAAPEELRLATDEALLRQVVRNLVNNALSFTEHGRVEVSAIDRQGGVVIEVSDTGIGIAADDLERVFDEFFQVRNALQTSRRGTGLGLPYARRVVETLGGQLTVTSRPGAGSLFTITFPPEAEIDATTGEPVRLGHVMIVDDDQAYRVVLEALVAPFVERVSAVESGERALELLARHDVDAMLLDLIMPDFGGIDVLAVVHDDPRLKSMPVLVVTSLPITEQLRHSLRGARDVVNKEDLTVDSMASIMRRLAR
jgi:CheY-like chemotaxis protein/anti-sigma regulatory factor (Ser/Thr protein kinase)